MKIYLASRYSRREELVIYAKTLRGLGHIITSRWLKGKHQISDDGLNDEGSREERERFAAEDLLDITMAELLLAFTEVPRSSTSRGGRHVEFGIALAQMKRIHVVGPRENVFYCLEDVRVFESFEDWLTALQRA